MKSKIYTIPQLLPPSSLVGNGNKGLLLVLSETDKNHNIQTLEGLVKAIKMDISKDVTIVSYTNEVIDLNSILSQNNYNTVILIGTDPSQVGFLLQANPYFYYRLEKFQLLITHSLAEMNADKSKKMAFWKNLQDKFLTG